MQLCIANPHGAQFDVGQVEDTADSAAGPAAAKHTVRAWLWNSLNSEWGSALHRRADDLHHRRVEGRIGTRPSTLIASIHLQRHAEHLADSDLLQRERCHEHGGRAGA